MRCTNTRSGSSRYLNDVITGAIAGAVATWAMSQVTTLLYRYESDAARQKEEDARGGQTAYASAAGRLAGAAGVSLDEQQKDRAASALHWSTGIGAGVGYALARRRWPGAAAGGGLPFGLGFFLAVDEGMNTAFGFTPPPAAFPWQAHARGAAGHVVFGLAAHGVLAAFERLAGGRRPRAVSLPYPA